MEHAFSKNPSVISFRREVVFLVLAGLFLGSLTMLNILGVSRFIDLSFTIFGVSVPFILTVGVLPYPITFLCTDFISELYGIKRANLVVWVGVMLNGWVLFILWMGGILPPEPVIDPATGIPPCGERDYTFYQIRMMTFSTTMASMIAYFSAQFCDVHIFHWLKRITKGKHLWLRNNGSTLISQLIDSVAVIVITFYLAQPGVLPIDYDHSVADQLTVLILSGYIFKLATALLDTIPFYIGVNILTKYLKMDHPLHSKK